MLKSGKSNTINNNQLDYLTKIKKNIKYPNLITDDDLNIITKSLTEQHKNIVNLFKSDDFINNIVNNILKVVENNVNLYIHMDVDDVIIDPYIIINQKYLNEQNSYEPDKLYYIETDENSVMINIKPSNITLNNIKNLDVNSEMFLKKLIRNNLQKEYQNYNFNIRQYKHNKELKTRIEMISSEFRDYTLYDVLSARERLTFYKRIIKQLKLGNIKSKFNVFNSLNIISKKSVEKYKLSFNINQFK